MFTFSGVVMIRCDIHKGKLRHGNFIEPGRDAQPRKDEGFVIDHGNIGKNRKWNYRNVIQPPIFARVTVKLANLYIDRHIF